MKIKKLIVCVVFIFFALLPAQELKKTRFYTEFDLYTGLKAGVCRPFTKRIALYSGMGIALISPLRYPTIFLPRILC